jgi:hypothetical protein
VKRRKKAGLSVCVPYSRMVGKAAGRGGSEEQIGRNAQSSFGNT